MNYRLLGWSLRGVLGFQTSTVQREGESEGGREGEGEGEGGREG